MTIRKKLLHVVRNTLRSGKIGGNHRSHPAFFRAHIDLVLQTAQQLLIAAARKVAALLVAVVMFFAATVDIVDRGAWSRAAWPAPISVQTRDTSCPPSSSAHLSSLRNIDDYW
jgi:hypothetical protein